jgi:hypothetical protein
VGDTGLEANEIKRGGHSIKEDADWLFFLNHPKCPITIDERQTPMKQWNGYGSLAAVANQGTRMRI